MEFRSTNPEGFVHFGGDVMSGANCTRGLLLSSNTLRSVSDNAAEGLSILPKGAGTLILGDGSGAVLIGGSTTSMKFVTGQSTTTIPNMPGASQDVSTFAAAGLSTGDLVLAVDARGTVSTHVAMGGYTIASANKVRVTWINCHASSISPESTGITVRWAYLDRT